MAVISLKSHSHKIHLFWNVSEVRTAWKLRPGQSCQHSIDLRDNLNTNFLQLNNILIVDNIKIIY